MQTIKLPIVMAVVLLAAIAGGVVSYVFFPSADPEMKALLQRQVELTEQEAAERERAAQATREFFDSVVSQHGPCATNSAQPIQNRSSRSGRYR